MIQKLKKKRPPAKRAEKTNGAPKRIPQPRTDLVPVQIRAIPVAQVLPTGKLDAAERKQLRACESTIRRNKQAFLEIGEALATIREKRLYREHYASFEAYCRTEWSFDGKEASDKIQAAKRFAIAAPIAKAHNVELLNESQLRALAGVDDPADLKAVILRAARKAKAEGRHVVARDLSAAKRQEFTPKEDLDRERLRHRAHAPHAAPPGPHAESGEPGRTMSTGSHSAIVFSDNASEWQGRKVPWAAALHDMRDRLQELSEASAEKTFLEDLFAMLQSVANNIAHANLLDCVLVPMGRPGSPRRA